MDRPGSELPGWLMPTGSAALKTDPWARLRGALGPGKGDLRLKMAALEIFMHLQPKWQSMFADERHQALLVKVDIS